MFPIRFRQTASPLRERRVILRAGVALMMSTSILVAPATADPMQPGDPILAWNDLAVRLLPGSAPVQTRAYAMVNIAMHDAVNATLGKQHHPWLPGVAVSGGDTHAAASQAARDVLVALNPANAAHYDAELAARLAAIPDGPAKQQGIATGAAHASAILLHRADDGAGASKPYTPSGLPGGWKPTPPAGAPAALPHWGEVDPFVLPAGNAVRPEAPPSLTGAPYADALNEVRLLGSITSETRTADQTESALFWNGANGSQWMRIGLTVAETGGLSVLENARLMALLATGLADTQIAGFDAKYAFDLWRPVTAIHEADLDGNPLTVADPLWTPLNAAPAHPSYISTLSALSGAGALTLGSVFGDAAAFCLEIGARTRCFDSFSAAAADASNSRVWGGIHFGFDSLAGLEMGRKIATLALGGRAFNPVPEPMTWATMIVGFLLVGARRRRADALRAVAG